MTKIQVIKLAKFMHNKRCPECDADTFVVKYKGGQEHQIWYCAKCERQIFKELIIKKEKNWNEGFIQILNLLRGGQR